jgi:hypothetical protein
MSKRSADIDTAFERWASEGRAVCAPPLDRFEVGDWLGRCPDVRRGYALATELTGVGPGALRQWRWVAANVAAEVRRPGVCFRRHRDVAALDPGQQTILLALADEGRGQA